MRMIMKNWFLILFVLSLTSCTENAFHEDKIFAGGVVATKAQLSSGKQIYMEYCMACHGAKGDGNGVASKGMSNPPRNFTLGTFKFGNVVSGDLVHDDTLINIIKKGLHGSGMLPWDVSEEQAFNVVQYIKTFAPDTWEGSDKTLGEKIKITKNPYGMARNSSAVARGKEVYHIIAQCWSCHRAYADKRDLNAMNKKINGEDFEDYDAEMYELKIQDSDHGYRNMPPDFTWHTVKSAKTIEDLYVRISAGVGGTTMASWQDTIEDDDIWAVAHYIKYLMDLKDKKEREDLVGKLP
ncbi:MAG: hypothetical protein DRQ88_03125 [Epsilonproteobacteria bacterium]|nr:MAG: hypothetical protein DRQ89_13300 [Campylobacterota bacterium]RLA67464.1 MAG: hypothetical protein DRQ88_03125 [Campylobacterota bacterium]